MAPPCTRINTFALVSLLVLASACQERSAGTASGTWASSQPQPNAALQSFVEGKTLAAVATRRPEMPAAERTRLVDQVRRVYKEHDYQLLWIDDDRPSERYRQFAKALEAADAHGLPRADYAMPAEISSDNRATISAEQAPQVDAHITATFFRYFTHLSGGRLDPRALQSLWTLKPERPDLVAALSNAVKNNDLTAVMDKLQPQHPEYRELQKALVR